MNRVLRHVLLLGIASLFFSCHKRPKKVEEIPVVAPTKPALPDSFAPTNNTVIETRIVLFDEMGTWSGPDFEYRKINDAPLLRGTTIHVIDESACWICFKTDTNAVAWTGWTHRFLSRPLDDASATNLENDIQHLTACGILVHIEPSENEALVNRKAWDALGARIQEGVGRALAFYCGLKKGTGLNWVAIGDADTRQKLAKYSENMGFKISGSAGLH